jgi:hypothetical protein
MPYWIDHAFKEPRLREQALVEQLQRFRRELAVDGLQHRMDAVDASIFTDEGFLHGWRYLIDRDYELEREAVRRHAAVFVENLAKAAAKEAATSAPTVRCADCQKVVDAPRLPT